MHVHEQGTRSGDRAGKSLLSFPIVAPLQAIPTQGGSLVAEAFASRGCKPTHTHEIPSREPTRRHTARSGPGSLEEEAVEEHCQPEAYTHGQGMHIHTHALHVNSQSKQGHTPQDRGRARWKRRLWRSTASQRRTRCRGTWPSAPPALGPARQTSRTWCRSSCARSGASTSSWPGHRRRRSGAGRKWEKTTGKSEKVEYYNALILQS